MNVYEVLVANAGDVTVTLVEATHIRTAVARVVRPKKSAPRDTYLKVLARRVATDTTLEQYTASRATLKI